jgi:hypothetical protein
VIRRARGPLLGLGGCLLVLGSTSACATTYDTAATTLPDTTTTVFVASGSTDELLTAISAEASALSEKLVEGEQQREALERIEAQWALVRPDIERDHPQLLGSFDAAIAHLQRSVERRRPADADKASKNLTFLIAASRP